MPEDDRTTNAITVSGVFCTKTEYVIVFKLPNRNDFWFLDVFNSIETLHTQWNENGLMAHIVKLPPDALGIAFYEHNIRPTTSLFSRLLAK